jgi:hypothetical protein
MTEIYYDASIPIENIIKSCHNPSERMKWDKDMETARVLEVDNKTLLWYQRNKSAVKMINQRDFVEKKITFSHENKKYIFFTSIPDEFKAHEPHVTRAYTITGF